MLDLATIQAHGQRLVLCPHCGGNGVLDLLDTSGVGVSTVRSRCLGCGHVSDAFFPSKQNVLRLVKEWDVGSPAHRLNLPTNAPLIVNYGASVDSTALLVAMVDQGIKPDLIIFADTYAERPETYAYLEYFDAWLQDQGFPSITRTAYKPPSAPYDSLESNCLVNETLPSISFRFKSCTLKWKAGAMDRYILGVRRGRNKRAGWAPALDSLARGVKPVKLIGYDAGPIDSCRSTKINEDKNFVYLYPLRDLGWTREDCISAIRAKELVVPIKSSCFYCCSVKEWELNWYSSTHPDLLARALIMEDNAQNGKHGLRSIRGLWAQKQSWREWAESNGVVAPGGYTVIADKKRLLQLAREGIPKMESNLDFALSVELQRHKTSVPCQAAELLFLAAGAADNLPGVDVLLAA